MIRSKIVTINGPLGHGKTWLRNRLEDHYKNHSMKRVVAVSFQDPLRRAAMNLVGLNPDTFSYDDFKKTVFHGKTGRELMILLSEEFAKPFYGEQFFVAVMSDAIRKTSLPSNALFVADSNGFEIELDWLRAQPDFDVLSVAIEPAGMKIRRGMPWQADDSRYNLAHKCEVVAENSTLALEKTLGALQRRNWV